MDREENMADTIQNNFNGILEISNDLTVAFNVSNNIVMLIPLPEQIEAMTNHFQSEPEFDKKKEFGCSAQLKKAKKSLF